jgi:sugar lactone lactonase YvrE
MKKFLNSLIVLASASMPMLAQPVITNQPASRALWAGGNVTFAVGVSNSSAFTYQWLFNSANLPNDVISTVAGDGSGSYSGDGGAATSAGLSQIYGDVEVDTSGNLFIPDSLNNRIRKVSTNGIITTVAGNGTGSYSGDGGAATNATMGLPAGVAVDAFGNMFIADSENNRIRKVNTNGIITTVAGNGNQSYSGDGGAAINASLNSPNGVALDGSGNLFIADRSNNHIRKVNTNGIITTVAGNSTGGYSGDGGAAINASLNEPFGMAVDVSGNLFIADSNNERIRKVDTNGIITTVAGNGYTKFDQGAYSGDGGAATNASLNSPLGVAVDVCGNLFIADTDNNRIREVNTNGIITTVAGNGGQGYSGDGGSAANAAFYYPSGVTVDAFDNIFISDEANNRIRKVTNTQGQSLALNNVSAANAGSYQLVVTGSGGSVTSSVVNLIVGTSPLIYKTVLNPDGSVALNFVSQPNSTNVVLCATNLVPPIVWQSIATNIAGADGNWQFTDTNAASYQTRFYRSLTQ